MIGEERLDDHPPRLRAPAGSTGDLGQELEGPLAGAEVGEVQAEVCGYDTDKCHSGNVVPLGHHLCPDENVHLATVERAKDPPLLPLAGCRVAVETLDAGVGEERPHLLRHPLGPEAEERSLGAAAARAGGGGILLKPAVVAP